MKLGWFGRVIGPAVLWLSLASQASAALVTLTGKVTDQNGVGIFGVTINFVDSCTGITAGAINNVTSSTGSFQATVNAGIYDLEVSPPTGNVFTAQRIRNFNLTSSKTLATVVLPFGIIVSGHITDAAGVGRRSGPVARANRVPSARSAERDIAFARGPRLAEGNRGPR